MVFFLFITFGLPGPSPPCIRTLTVRSLNTRALYIRPSMHSTHSTTEELVTPTKKMRPLIGRLKIYQ